MESATILTPLAYIRKQLPVLPESKATLEISTII